MTTIDVTYSNKRPNEKEFFGMDFSKLMTATDSIATVTVTSTVLKGVADATAASMIIGASVINGFKVTQIIGGGINKNTYALRFAITTALGLELELVGSLLILD